MNAKIITISREFGSGGRSIGKLVAEQLGYAFYDKALVERIAKESGYAEDFIERRGEDATSKSSFLFNLSRSGGGGFDGMPAITDKLYVIQYNTIKKLAEESPCVIVGRCSDYILRNEPDSLHVFIHADAEFRARRIVEIYGERDNAPLKRVEEKDKKRQVYYKNYTGRIWGMSENFDLCLNSGKIVIEKCAEIIVGLAKK